VSPSFVRFFVKLTTIARRNELLVRARRRSNFVASDLEASWPGDRISLHERASVSERRTFNEARQLARSHGVC